VRPTSWIAFRITTARPAEHFALISLSGARERLVLVSEFGIRRAIAESSGCIGGRSEVPVVRCRRVRCGGRFCEEISVL